MEKFLLLFRNEMAKENAFQELSPEDMQAEIAKWNVWIGGIAAQGKLISTEALVPTGRMVAQSGNVITDGPFAETKEIVGGFMLLQAADYAEAAELSTGCPYLGTGGSVEVRQIQNFG
jgi:hypothetical protein